MSNDSQESETPQEDSHFEIVADETRTRIHQGNVEMEVHQPHGALMVYDLHDGVEITSRVTDQARANTRVQLTWEQAREVRDRLTELIENE